MTEFDRARRRTEARLAKIARMAAHGVYQGKARLLNGAPEKKVWEAERVGPRPACLLEGKWKLPLT